MIQFDTVQKFGRDGANAALRSFEAISAGAQTAAVETTNYAKRSFEQGTQLAEKLVGTRTLEAAIQVQSEFLKSSYEGFVAQTAKMGELAVNTAKQAIAPLESLVAQPGR